MQNRKRQPWIGGTLYRCNSGHVESIGYPNGCVASNGFFQNRSQKLGGIIRLKQRWGLSWHARLFVISVMLLAIYAVVLNVHPFGGDPSREREFS
jgi:hypothetical protein